jgi:hypothetical protein
LRDAGADGPAASTEEANVLAGRAFELGNMQHGHNDGTWHEMEQVRSEAATEDPERGWLHGVIFRCKVCAEEIRVVQPVDVETPTEPLTSPG